MRRVNWWVKGAATQNVETTDSHKTLLLVIDETIDRQKGMLILGIDETVNG
jgi:hypothetical protein